MPTALQYAEELIRFDSVTAKSNVPISDHVETLLKRLGFQTERIEFTDPQGVPKVNVLGKLGSGHGGVGYFCHTDVVPVMNWGIEEHGPFEPTVRDGKLYGRGSTDMKGSLACFLAAVDSLAGRRPAAPVYICCTADEEVGMLGAEYVVAQSAFYREMVDGRTRGLVGEPTGLEVVHGHKGGCGMVVTARGIAAHSSTAEGESANWKLIPFLAEMKALHEELEADPRWQNPDFSPPTLSLNLGINDFNPALNITAKKSVCQLYFRAMPGISADPIFQRIQDAAERCGLEFEQTFRSTPFYRDPQSPFVQECLQFAAKKTPRTVAYGTDAARFQNLEQCVVFGPGDIAQAHTPDEWVALESLEQGTETYRAMILHWCG